MNRLIAMALILACAGGLAAQATLNITGTAQTGNENLHLVNIDFGGSATTTNVTLAISGNSATEGLQVFMGDLDQMAATGAGTDNGSAPDTTTINLTITSGNYTGVHQFIVSVQSGTGTGPVNYTGTLTAVSIPTGVTAAGTQVVTEASVPPVKRYFDRAVNGTDEVNSSGDTVSQEFLVNFGAVAQSITFHFFAEASLMGSIDIYEVLANGTLSPIGTLSGATDPWSDSMNVSTSSRSGMVRLHVECSDADSIFDWVVILPGTVSAVQGAQLNFAGNLSADQRRAYLVRLDYGANLTSYVMTLAAATATGTLDVVLVNLNELAANGSTNAIGGFEANTVLLPAQTGVFEFLIFVIEDGSAPATYNFTIEIAVAQAALVNAGTKTINDVQSFTNMFDRGVLADTSFTAAGTRTFEFNVDFGASAHSAEVFLQGEGSNSGPIELFEITSGGTASLVASVAGMGSFGDEDNGTTGVRTGVVRFRVVVTAGGAEDYSFSVIFDDSVAVSLLKKKKDDSDEGCSTGTSTGMGWLALLGLLASLIAASRLRAAHE